VGVMYDACAVGAVHVACAVHVVQWSGACTACTAFSACVCTTFVRAVRMGPRGKCISMSKHECYRPPRARCAVRAPAPPPASSRTVLLCAVTNRVNVGAKSRKGQRMFYKVSIGNHGHWSNVPTQRSFLLLVSLQLKSQRTKQKQKQKHKPKPKTS
jgi:hypothetical protein